MADLGTIEKHLNADPQLWQDFCNDPIDVLKREGLDLAPHMQKDLKDAVARLKSAKQSVAGSTTIQAPQGAKKIIISLGQEIGS